MSSEKHADELQEFHCSARGRPEISLFALFSDVAAVGDPGLSHGEKVNFGFVCSPDGWNEASPVPASYPAHAHNGVKPLNNGTRQRAGT